MSFFSYFIVYGVSFAYFAYLVRLVRLSKIHLIDFFFNLLICVVPPIYVTFYFSIERIISGLGIKTPFLVLFASFIVMLFLYISRIVIFLHKAEKRQTRIIEELALITHELNALKKSDINESANILDRA
jgi:hypothetical protein